MEVVYIMLLLGKQCETITRSFLRLHCRLSFALTGACDFIVVLRHHCRSLRHSCRLVANCHLPTPVGSCCFIRQSSERPKLVSIVAASSPACCGIIADFHSRSQALATSLSSYDIIVVHCGTHAVFSFARLL